MVDSFPKPLAFALGVLFGLFIWIIDCMVYTKIITTTKITTPTIYNNTTNKKKRQNDNNNRDQDRDHNNSGFR